MSLAILNGCNDMSVDVYTAVKWIIRSVNTVRIILNRLNPNQSPRSLMSLIVDNESDCLKFAIPQRQCLFFLLRPDLISLQFNTPPISVYKVTNLSPETSLKTYGAKVVSL